ncbi:MAG: ATP-binding protein, partial [Gammaproteobacteria bacterium]|nr:ATP-binding protein [Gammaproteobacteria bacterium]
MQVMNGGEIDQRNVLIGQKKKTVSFGVTADPILMGMLSTGLYSKPMRTMVQEVMFNAWDAHRMADCQDRPIDIYINDTSGLIVRDYGPGIKDDDMEPIYCIYGNSTKRDDDDLTGGFGLGSKSPYAYTDSFMVTSHFEQKKSMYIMNRVSEENNGSPGMTTIIDSVPTEESGLLVTIPLKTESDQQRVYDYIIDLLYLSGIKANIHYNGKTKLVESDSLEPGKWIVSLDKDDRSALWAVYGGVRYRITNDEFYADEYKFVKNLSDMLGSIYIGFKPSTLTPLPNREALNLNDSTVNHIKTQLEIIEESFQTMVTPLAKIILTETMNYLVSTDLEPKFIAEIFLSVGATVSFNDLLRKQTSIIQRIKEQCPADMNQAMWNSLTKVCLERTTLLQKTISTNKLQQMKYILWAKNFPNHMYFKPFFLRDNLFGVERFVTEESHKTCKDLLDAKEICDHVTGSNHSIRVRYRENWLGLTNTRRAGKFPSSGLNHRQEVIVKDLKKSNKLKLSKKEYPDRLWFTGDGTELITQLQTKTIIMAKTVAALNETRFAWQKFFSPNSFSTSQNYEPLYWRNIINASAYSAINLIPAIIVHQSKGGYDKARQALLDAGWIVHEADEPIKKEKPIQAPVSRGKPTYPLCDPDSQYWASQDQVENPTCYLTLNQSAIEHHYSCCPPMSVVRYVAANTPRLVILHSKGREGVLEKKNIPTFNDKLRVLVE